MTDRTSWSYRANLPGGNPDMYKEGGKARDAFKDARCSPYIREQTEQGTQSGDEQARQRFRTKRRTPKPALTPRGGPLI
ncbi:hypothetical protein [uncultured Erythrobacter sp.]|uniref:hypothetical protein n=1 Tax=uncultured Erythrobacter sp. TaxID=263913 RepID=UPI00261471BC|nr:hypothetical protein [uncultured Erythrobacter sp.]